MTDIKQKVRELLSRAETHGTSVVISLDDMRAIEAALQQREPEYDRELIADMLGNYANIGGGVFATDLIRGQALLLIAATNAHAAGVHTAKVGFSADEAELRRILGDSIGAKTVIDLELLRKQVDAVSALVEKWRAMRREYDGSAGDALYNCADELEAALKGGKANG